MAKSTLLNIKFRYGSLFIPLYRLVLTTPEALSAVNTTGIALLSTRNVS